jgi:NTP pyrophosphatase (non-canonical NTP hydrolase)
MDSKTLIQEAKEAIKEFNTDRDWSKFHDPKSVASVIAIEAAELQELFLWLEKAEVIEKLQDSAFRQKVEDELADVFNACLNFANMTGIDITTATSAKIEQNNKKYPVEKAKGKATKYTEL